MSPSSAHQLFGARHAIGRRRSGQHDARAEALGARALGRRDGGRHDDGRRHAEELRRERDRLRVIARRRRDDAARARLGIQLREKIVRAAELERAAALQHLRLDPDRRADFLRDRVGRKERGAHGDRRE